MNVISIGSAVVVAVLAVIFLRRLSVVNASPNQSKSNQQPLTHPQPGPADFVILEADSPVVPASGSLKEDVGLETLGAKFSPILKYGSKLPVCDSETFSTGEDNQETLSVRIYRGSDNKTKNNTFMGEVRVTGYTLGPRGTPQIRVSLKAADRSLAVGAIDLQTGNSLKPEVIKDPESIATD